MMIWACVNLIEEFIHQAECVNYAISSNLLDQSFEMSSVIKFSFVTAQQMRCFVIDSQQFDSDYSLIRVLCGHRFYLLNL